MPNIRLPDGAVKQFDAPGHRRRSRRVDRPRPRQGRARRQGRRQARRHVATLIDRDATLAIVTDKDADGLDIIRHSTAHLLAYAVKELFPDAQVTIGPVIENGFYYDFAYKRPFTPEDLAAIEKQHGRAREEGRAGRRAACCRATRRSRTSRRIGEHYKAEIIASIPAERGRSRSTREGGFTDLCRGPHVPSHRQAQGLQADEGRRRVLARRLEATRCCSASTAPPGRTKEDLRRVPAHARGGREARPPQARRAARPLPPAGRGAGHGVLASEGLGALAAGRAVHAPRLPRQRLPGSARARRSSTARCGRRSGHWENYRRTCSRRSRRSATTRSSR